jgi:hypothetical protein
VQRSPDGEWYWDGAQWRAAFSPDRRWRWDGQSWVPAVPQQVQRWRYEPTEWTRRLQLIVIGVTVLGILVALIGFPTVLMPAVQQSVDRSLALQSANSGVDPQQVRSITTSMINLTLWFSAVLGLAVAAIFVIGSLRLWQWVYWLAIVVYLLALLALPQYLLGALGVDTTGLVLPGWWWVFGSVLALAEGALGIWMIVLARRSGGAWARRRVPA